VGVTDQITTITSFKKIKYLGHIFAKFALYVFLELVNSSARRKGYIFKA